MHAVIFDIDGTLLQSVSVDDDLYRSSLRAVLGPVKFRENFWDYDHVSDSGILWQVLQDNSLADRPNPKAEIASHFVDSLRTFISTNGSFPEVPGARKMVSTLRSSANHVVAIATGGWHAAAKLKLLSAGFELEGIPISASDDERDRTKIMLAALARPEREYESITYYGDGPWDRDACDSLGWTFVPVGSTLGGINSYPELEVD